MKIAISSMGASLEDSLDSRFGRCAYFQIYDTETKEGKAIQNKGQISGGGAGIAAAQQLIDEHIDIIITGNLGPNAFNLIDKTDIKVYKSAVVDVNSAIKEYREGNLSELKSMVAPHTGMNMGGNRK
ncbi:NifB/NifX family molybdenum-iron cluster-binding protein [Clostridium oceanicum]|uniref:NifB/NifX family molybdenum-iron cluster-binding protein n=1 Tax=Clostridium oceanicum TaxID=1543 RepID=A0ABP3UKK7_9CLOT